MNQLLLDYLPLVVFIGVALVLSLALLILALGVLVVVLLPTVAKKRAQVFVEED